MNKVTPSEQSTGQKWADFQIGTTRAPLALKSFMCLTTLHFAILGESIHATRAGLIKSGIEALNFRVVRANKPISITGMRTPQVVQVGDQ